MSDPKAGPDENAEIDATGVDADFVTSDPDPEIDPATPGESQKAKGDNADHEDELEVGDLP